MIEFNNRRKKKDRRIIYCFIDNDRRKGAINRRGEEIRKIKREKRKQFERHLKAQR